VKVQVHLSFLGEEESSSPKSLSRKGDILAAAHKAWAAPSNAQEIFLASRACKEQFKTLSKFLAEF